MVGVLLSISVSCGVDSGNLSSIPCTIAVVVMMKITSSTQAKSSSGVMLMSDTAPCDLREKRLMASPYFVSLVYLVCLVHLVCRSDQQNKRDKPDKRVAYRLTPFSVRSPRRRVRPLGGARRGGSLRDLPLRTSHRFCLC